MSFGSLYPQGVDDALMARVRQPTAPQETGFSTWSFSKAAAGGVPSAAFEVGGSWLDALSVSDQQMQRAGRPGVIGAPEARPSLGGMSGESARAKADEFAPDPLTAHTADKVVHGLTRFVTKAVGAVGTMGPVAGGAALGLEEGNTTKQRLIADGVDADTAAQVGAVTGAFSALGAVLPAGGGTLAKTLGIAAVGGPVTFMAQEGLSREILQRADYADKAAEHDPTDPLGLILSTVPGLAVGGLHMRGVAKRQKAITEGRVPLEQMKPDERKALKYNDPAFDAYAEAAADKYGVPPAILLAIKNAGEKSNPKAVSPKGAQGVMQFMPSTAKEMGITDPTDPIQSIDGAARYMRKLFDAYGSWDAAVAHYNGGGSQAALVRSGQAPSFKETAAYLDRVRAYVRDSTAGKAAADPEIQAAARVQVAEEALTRSLPDVPGARAQVLKASDDLAEGVMPDLPPVRDVDLPEFKTWFGDSKVVDESGQPLVVYHGTRAEFDQFTPGSHFGTANQANEILRYESRAADSGELVAPVYLNIRNPKRVDDVKDWPAEIAAAKEQGFDGLVYQNWGEFDPDKAGNPKDSYIAFSPDQIKSAIGNSGRFDPNSASLTDPLQPGEVSPREIARRRQASNTLPQQGETAQAAVKSEAPPPLDSQRVQQIATETPDLRVRLPGSDETVTVADALERAKAEAADDAQFADLLKVAADCAVSFG